MAPAGKPTALKVSGSWSRSLARMVKRSGLPTTATLSPIGASSGGSVGDSDGDDEGAARAEHAARALAVAVVRATSVTT